jgi:subtilisin-like proprotein convertase family protein
LKYISTFVIIFNFLVAINSLQSQEREVGTISNNRCFNGFYDAGINVVSVPSHDEFYLGNGTIEAWVYCFATGPKIIVRKDHEAILLPAYTFGIEANSHLYFWFENASYHYANNDGVTIPINTWTHVAVTLVKNTTTNYTVKWYVNGVQSGTSQTVTGEIFGQHYSLGIGGDYSYGGTSFYGYIDEVRFWNRTLSAAEILNNRFTTIGDKGGANTGGNITNSTTYNGLFASYTFNYKASNVFEDISGFNGTYLGNSRSGYCIPGYPLPYNLAMCVPNSSTMDYVKVQDNTVLAGTPGTIEAWVYISSSSAYKQTIAIKGLPSNPALSFWFFLDASTNKLGFSVGSSTVVSSGAGIPLNTWTHVAVSYRVPPSALPRVDFYINGTLNGTGTISNAMPVNTEVVQIGNSTTYNNCLKGYIDELRFWGNKRDVDSIKAYMYASSKTLKGSWLKAAYPFDGNACNYSVNTGLDGAMMNNAKFSGYLNESTPGVISNVFVAHPTNLNYQFLDSVSPSNIFPQKFQLSAPNKTIPDLSTIYDTITISDVAGNVSSAEVFLAIQHLYVGDLQVTVIAPNGTQAIILNRAGGSGKHILTIFKDYFPYGTSDANNLLPPWSPFVKPDNNMVTFGNSPINGAWKIKITDAASGDAGTLMEWGLMLNSTVGIHNNEGEVPTKYTLSQNYPNPFNPSTIIKFQIKDSRFVKLIVYDLLGKEVTKLVNEKLKAGEYEVSFKGGGLASGIYIYKLEAGDFADTKKMILIK